MAYKTLRTEKSEYEGEAQIQSSLYSLLNTPIPMNSYHWNYILLDKRDQLYLAYNGR